MNNIGPSLHSNRPTVVAFGGGKGGAGRSTLCADTARALARQNQRILCVDTSWSCPTLNILLGTDEPPGEPGRAPTTKIGAPGSHLADFIHTTSNPHIWMISMACGGRLPFVQPDLKPETILAQLHELDFDWIFLDLSAQCDPLSVGLFTLSDIPILICTPEASSIRETTQFLRAALYQAILYHPDTHGVREDILDMLAQQTLTYNAQSLRYDAPSAACRRIVEETALRFETYVIVNQVREGAEHDLGFVLAHALYRELNLYPRVLASIDYQDRRWFFNRRTTGIPPVRHDETIAADIEQLARSIRHIAEIDKKYPRPMPQGPDVHPAVRMGVSTDASRNEVRQHCRRLWEGYRRETTISLVFSDPNRRLATAEELEELYRKVLTMPNESFSRLDADTSTSLYAHSSEASWDGERAQRRNQPPPEYPPHARPFERYLSSTATPTELQESSSPERETTREFTGTAPISHAPPASITSPDATAESTDPSAPNPTSENTPNQDAPATPRGPKPSPGRVVENLRRQHNISLQELSLRTHIGVKFLAAIEDVDLETLPRDVYLRGYLREIARVLDADPQDLISRYFRYLQDP